MTTAPTPGRPLTDDQREVLWTAAAQHAWRGVTTAPEALFDAVERIKADAQAEVANAFMAWAAANEVAEPPLDWAWFGEILRRYSPLYVTDSTPRPVLDVAPCGCHFPKIAGCDHDEPADSTPSEDR